MGLAAYGIFTLPILAIDREAAGPEEARLATRGWGANWFIGLLGIGSAILLSNPIPLALVFLAGVTGAWLEVVMRHDGAP